MLEFEQITVNRMLIIGLFPLRREAWASKKSMTI